MRSGPVSYAHKRYVLGEAYHLALMAGKYHELYILEALIDDTYNRGNARCPVRYDHFFEVGIIWPNHADKSKK